MVNQSHRLAGVPTSKRGRYDPSNWFMRGRFNLSCSSWSWRCGTPAWSFCINVFAGWLVNGWAVWPVLISKNICRSELSCLGSGKSVYQINISTAVHFFKNQSNSTEAVHEAAASRSCCSWRNHSSIIRYFEEAYSLHTDVDFVLRSMLVVIRKKANSIY